MAKAPDAFRTISEVSDTLDTPAHVLRFWESKFSQIKPVKRAGGRRYYRPEDIDLLAGIKLLLHEQGMTIKGAQKLLREKGIKHVAALASHADTDDGVIEAEANVADPNARNLDLFSHTRPVPAPENIAERAFAILEGTPAAAPERKSAPEAPRPVAQDMGPRILAAIAAADPDKLRRKAAQIAPLLTRLENLRDQMRGL